MKKTTRFSFNFDIRYQLARQIIHLRIYIILACVLISAFFISVLKDIEIETRLEDFLPQQHPFIKVQNLLTDTFGGLNQVSIALKVKEGDIFTYEALEKIVSLTEDLYLLEGVNIARVNSIASRHIKHIQADEEGFFVERLLRQPPRDSQEMAEFRRKIVSNPNVYRRMVSDDFSSTLIYVDFTSGVRTSFIFRSLEELKDRYEDENTELYIAGRPILEGWLNSYLPKMLRILVISFLIISGILYLTFRSKRGIILPLLDSSMATLWGMGTMKLIGLRLDPSTVLVPFIVLSLGISHSVHTLKRYYEEMRDPRMKSKHAIVSTMAHLFIPGLACVLTDGFGFLSLMLVPLPTIKSMAFASGLGILANFFTSFMFTPAVLSFMHRPKILEIEKEEKHRWVDAMLLKLSVFSLSRRAGTIVVVIFIMGGLISFVGISKIVVGDNSQGSSYLYPESSYNRAEKFINTHFGGTNSYYVLVESDRSVLSGEALTAMDGFQAYLEDIPEVGSTVSVANAIKGLNMFMKEGKERYYTIPESDQTIAEYWFLYTLSGFPSDFDYLISRDEKTANIKLNVKDHTAKTIARIVEATRQYASRFQSPHVRFRYAGGDIGILSAVNDIVRRTILPNILFISLLIFIYVSFVYRSFAAAGLLLLPLTLSNLIVFSLYGFLGTSITVETLPLASLSEGLGINYGIYMMARLYQEMREKKMTYKNILYHTLITSGKAVFFSGFIVSLGIFAWIFSSILLQVKLGLNLCIALILNMVISLVMIPVLVWWIKPSFLFGKMRLRLKNRVKHKVRFRKSKRIAGDS